VAMGLLMDAGIHINEVLWLTVAYGLAGAAMLRFALRRYWKGTAIVRTSQTERRYCHAVQIGSHARGRFKGMPSLAQAAPGA